MAIKFVDVEPEEAGKPRKKAEAPPARGEPDAVAPKDSLEPELPHAKPAPKKRGRR